MGKDREGALAGYTVLDLADSKAHTAANCWQT